MYAFRYVYMNLLDKGNSWHKKITIGTLISLSRGYLQSDKQRFKNLLLICLRTVWMLMSEDFVESWRRATVTLRSIWMLFIHTYKIADPI